MADKEALVEDAKDKGASAGSNPTTTITNSEMNPPTEPVSEPSGDESEDESEILEESPCGRWLKRREEVKYRDVPGIDCAYLAMDTEEGVEVVWNEAQFSETKKFKAQEDKLKHVFEALTLIEHPNIVKFHRYWTDLGRTDEKTGEKIKPRVILITEFMSSGSLKQFLKRTKKNNRKIPIQSWKRWCTQILSALSYLHTCSPPIIHGNLTCDSIFIQHNGLVKIGSVAPDAIHKNVKTFRENIKNLHFIAPEWSGLTLVKINPQGAAAEAVVRTDDAVAPGPPIDIYAFGMCALETAVMELVGNGDTVQVTQEVIDKNIDSLEDELQKDFFRKCLMQDPAERPTARELLFHPVLFEVHSLKLLAAHTLVKNPASSNETMTDEAIQKHYGLSTVMASMKCLGEEGPMEKLFKLSDFPIHEKLEKFMEDVKYGIYPLTAFAFAQPPHNVDAPNPLELPKSDKSCSLEPQEIENRRILKMQCTIQPKDGKGSPQLSLTILLRMEDNMNRQLSCLLNPGDDGYSLSHELVQHGFIHQEDTESINEMLTGAIEKYETGGGQQEVQPQAVPAC